MVCGRQGPAAQSPDRGAGHGPSAPVQIGAGTRRHSLDQRRSAGTAAAMQGQNPLSPARSGLCRQRIRRRLSHSLRVAATRHHARAIRCPLPRRCLPWRRHHPAARGLAMSPMPMQKAEAQAMALAGLLQAVYLVDHIARTGQADEAGVNATLHSLFVFESDDPVDVYGGSHNLQLGLRLLRDALSGQRREEYTACVKYAFGVLHLQRKLEASPKTQATIRTRLLHAEKKLEYFTQDINEIAASIAAIYQDTISHFNYRIQVAGSFQQLQVSANSDRIRALLLAAIRSAWLWRRLGGRRWHLLLRRGRLQEAAKNLLRD